MHALAPRSPRGSSCCRGPGRKGARDPSVCMVGFNANGLVSEESHLMLFEKMTKRNLDVVAVTESHLPGDGDIQYRGYPDFHILHHGGVQMRDGGGTKWGVAIALGPRATAA